MTLSIRPARADDVDAMRELIDKYAAQDLMLSRTREFLLENLGDYLVAEGDRFVGCCALATLTPDLADHLARQGVPFREAHEIVGRLVRERIAVNKELAGITLGELRAADPRFGETAVAETGISRSLASRSSPGGTAPERVRAAIDEARSALRA